MPSDWARPGAPGPPDRPISPRYTPTRAAASTSTDRRCQRPPRDRDFPRSTARRASVERWRVGEAEHDLQASRVAVADDIVELRKVVVARAELDRLPLDLLGHPVEPGLGHIADDVGPGNFVVVLHVH